MLDRTEGGQSVDVLAEILDTVHVEAAKARVFAADRELKGEDIETGGFVIFVVRNGRFACDFSGERIEIGEGDALALLHGVEQVGTVDAIVASVGQASVLRCTCHFADPEKNPLLGALPRFVHVSSHQWVEAQWLEPTIAWIEREAVSKSPGAKVIVNRLVELLWVQLVRTHIATSPAATHGWLRALSDAQVGGALCLIHEKPAAPFTVAGLALAVGMSRSAFASQFTRLVGEPPLHYVARWRMLRASQLLREDKQTLADVAIAVGYESEAAFSKAFKRWSGQAPGSYRRDRRSGPAPAAQMLAG